MSERKTVTAYWNSGGFYLECEPETWHPTESSMYRRAHYLGYTHVKVLHGYYSTTTRSFEVQADISERMGLIPKRYRSDAA